MIRVIIERQIAETLEPHYERIAKSVLQAAVSAPGFISGESLRDMQDPNHRLIWCTWRSVQDWQRWESSAERKQAMTELAPMLSKEEKVTILEHCQSE